jgi:predicted nucleic acid-binding protein
LGRDISTIRKGRFRDNRGDASALGPIAVTSTRLDLASDPADELIAATSVVHRVPLVTRDPRLLASRVVPLALP